MTVVTTYQEISLCSLAKPDDLCTLCHGKLWAPFMEWHGKTNVFFCSKCCEEYKTGITADLIQVVAIAELQRLYANRTLLRHDSNKHTEEARKELAAAGLTPSGVHKLHGQ